MIYLGPVKVRLIHTHLAICMICSYSRQSSRIAESLRRRPQLIGLQDAHRFFLPGDAFEQRIGNVCRRYRAVLSSHHKSQSPGEVLSEPTFVSITEQ